MDLGALDDRPQDLRRFLDMLRTYPLCVLASDKVRICAVQWTAGRAGQGKVKFSKTRGSWPKALGSVNKSHGQDSKRPEFSTKELQWNSEQYHGIRLTKYQSTGSSRENSTGSCVHVYARQAIPERCITA